MAIAYAHPRGIKDFPMCYMYNKVTDTFMMSEKKNLSNDESLEMNVGIPRKILKLAVRNSVLQRKRKRT